MLALFLHLLLDLFWSIHSSEVPRSPTQAAGPPHAARMLADLPECQGQSKQQKDGVGQARQPTYQDVCWE